MQLNFAVQMKMSVLSRIPLHLIILTLEFFKHATYGKIVTVKLFIIVHRSLIHTDTFLNIDGAINKKHHYEHRIVYRPPSFYGPYHKI